MRKGRRCLDCGKTLTGMEWDLGACLDCLKKRARERKWEKHGTFDSEEWKWVDIAPRFKEICPPEEIDIQGIVLLYEVVFLGGKHYRERIKNIENQA